MWVTVVRWRCRCERVRRCAYCRVSCRSSLLQIATHPRRRQTDPCDGRPRDTRTSHTHTQQQADARMQSAPAGWNGGQPSSSACFSAHHVCLLCEWMGSARTRWRVARGVKCTELLVPLCCGCCCCCGVLLLGAKGRERRVHSDWWDRWERVGVLEGGRKQRRRESAHSAHRRANCASGTVPQMSRNRQACLLEKNG